MASTITKPAKQLGELLQQQQEPFVLDLYLIERGYVKKGLNLKSRERFACCNGDSNKKGISRCSRILRVIVKKFGRNKNCEGKFSVNNGQEVAEPDWFSSASSTNMVYNSWSESDKDESLSDSLRKNHKLVAADTLDALRLTNMTDEEVSSGGEIQCQFKANNRHHSPVSVLEELPSSQLKVRTRQGQPKETTCTVILPNKLVTEDSNSMLSASLCKLHFHSDSQKPNRNSPGITYDDPTETIRSNNNNNNTSPQFMKSKRMLHRTRQLLFDCVKEIVESHAKEEEKVNKLDEGFLGAEELGNLLWEKMKVWGKLAGDETDNKAYLLSLSLFDSAKEWSGLDQEKREICSQIGDSIAEVIVNELVIELSNYDFLPPITC